MQNAKNKYNKGKWNLNIEQVKEKAKTLKETFGGIIFAFPLVENNPYSKYAISYYTGEQFVTFPDELNVSEVAAGIIEIMETLNKVGMNIDYDNDVRFMLHDAQINAPDVTMRKLKKEGVYQSRTEPLLKEKEDIITRTDTGEEDYYFTPIGIVKFSYLSMIDDKMPKAIEFMDGFYKLLAMNKYGKTSAAIKQEVRRKGKVEGIEWIEKVYKKYIKDDYAIHRLMSSLKS